MATTLSQQILLVTQGHIPATTLLEDLVRLAPEFDRTVDYVFNQIESLKLGKVGLAKLHEACGYDSRRAFKALLAYEHDFVEYAPLHAAIAAGDEACFHGLEAMVNAMEDRQEIADYFAMLQEQ